MVCMDWQVSLTNWLEFRYRMNKFFFSISGWVKTAPQMLENNRNWIWFSHCHCLLLYIPINSLYEKIVWDTWSRARKKSNSKWALWGLTFVILPLHDENKNQTITILWTYKGSKKKNTNNVIIWKSMSFLPIYNNNNGNNRFFPRSFLLNMYNAHPKHY